MNPEEFVEKWKITRYELCDLVGRTIDTVNHWFSEKSPRQPEPDALHKLALIDAIWTMRRYQEQNLPGYVATYEMVRDRLGDSAEDEEDNLSS